MSRLMLGRSATPLPAALDVFDTRFSSPRMLFLLYGSRPRCLRARASGSARIDREIRASREATCATRSAMRRHPLPAVAPGGP